MNDTVTDCKEQTDEEIMVRVITAREAFACIVDRYEAKLLRYLKRMMPGLGEEVYDVLQEVFIKTYVNAQGFDATLSFSSWVYRIAHNEAINWLRKKKVRPETVDLGEDDFQTFAQSMELATGKHEQALKKDAVTRILARMPEKYYTVLVLHFLEGKNYEEISDILSMPSGTVATHIHRAKKEFSSMYEKHHD